MQMKSRIDILIDITLLNTRFTLKCLTRDGSMKMKSGLLIVTDINLVQQSTHLLLNIVVSGWVQKTHSGLNDIVTYKHFSHTETSTPAGIICRPISNF
jgi:hypothetical protein